MPALLRISALQCSSRNMKFSLSLGFTTNGIPFARHEISTPALRSILHISRPHWTCALSKGCPHCSDMDIVKLALTIDDVIAMGLWLRVRIIGIGSNGNVGINGKSLYVLRWEVNVDAGGLGMSPCSSKSNKESGESSAMYSNGIECDSALANTVTLNRSRLWLYWFIHMYM